MHLARSSGVQLHPRSLPSGRLGPEAHAFVDWLAKAGQSWWQMLPLGPPDAHGSPYRAASAFAASPALLARPDAPVSAREEARLHEREAFWIDDWAAYAGEGAIADQVRFDREWRALSEHAASRGVRLVGDIPIYVAPGSADHVTHPELFLDGLVAGAPPDAFSATGQLWGNPLYDWPALRRRGYRWWTERIRRTLALVDVARIDHFRGFVASWAVPAGASDARAGSWRRGPGRAPFDAAARHLRAAAPGHAVRASVPDEPPPADARGAGASRMHVAPDAPGLPFIAEDLGIITPPVTRLRDALGLPGMVVVQFGYDPARPHSPHRLDRHRPHRVAYTGTHDHDTARGWYEALDDARRAAVDADLDARGVREPDVSWSLIRLTLFSRASLAMLQLQDVLGLGSEARMNVPGREDDRNWRWRLEPGQLTPDHARRLRAATEASGRLPA